MSDISKQSPVHKLEVLRELAAARAQLFAVGEYSLQEAVDFLQAWAMRNGLVRQIGQDAVQKIIAGAFQEVRDDL